jgi:hypothetical protein
LKTDKQHDDGREEEDHHSSCTDPTRATSATAAITYSYQKKVRSFGG